MNGVSAVAAGERLTWAEICGRYVDEWVTLVEIDWVDDSSFDMRSAIVLSHGLRRGDALAQARPLLPRYNEFGCFFTGPVLRYPTP